MIRPAMLTAAAAALVLTAPALAQEGPVNTRHYQLNLETVAQGLEHPWGLALLPDGGFLVTERNSGNLRVGTAGGSLSDPLEGMPEVFRFEGETGRSQSGLFDVKLDPGFAETGIFYFSYARPTERGAALAIDRAELEEREGDMLHGGLVTEGIVRLRIAEDGTVEEESIGIGRRIRDVAVAEDGTIWLLTEHEDGEVIRVTPGEG